ncbi:pimeloyl-ACP methyl ester carboxylesterase [Microbacterium sp. W4I4]|uniref:alpha/beta fold hydrolase n=1 Tax=Microbacterium sp. W4I4 TaxID=3042295 RepID=UPI002789FDD0|nr:alpha/beta fold hydrolase [Microbacterium sp. W4I4]MDQ0613166.1 pimeloyl-ACP methyl ester carboxylesterase [Microbacterium sp. W4I4]
MLLNTIDSGSGDRVVLLLHGMMGSAESWWRIAPALQRSGYRVIAIDLPGHGLSPRDEACSVASVAGDVIESVQAIAPGAPLDAIGHSYGGTVLAAVAERMPIRRAVYVDTACAFSGGEDQLALAARYEADRRSRTDPVWLRASRPFYSETDAVVEARAAERFHPMTAASISSGADVAHEPAPGSILVRAEPSRFVTDADAERFRSHGVDVRGIPGAAHSVWYSHFDEFCATLPELFA